MEYILEKMSTSDPQLHLLETITEGFAKKMKIGSGGYGEVYKGELNGDEFAVKRLFSVPGLDDKAFDNEFRNLKKVQHKNVIRMIGYCYEISHKDFEYEGKLVWSRVIVRALCFEYMKGGSLANHISADSCIHDWPTTYKIISGTCEGLHHLHNAGENKIFHLDLKPNNVLLDENLVPKIGDFGLSRLFGTSYTHQISTSKGTIGFMPQEYIHSRNVSPKNDVFSLGVIIFHMMAGAKGYDDYCDARRLPNFYQKIQQEFIESALEYWKTKMQATEGYTWDGTDVLSVTECIEMAMRCVEDDRDKRPSIAKIFGELKQLESKIREMLKQYPKPLARQVGARLLPGESEDDYKKRVGRTKKLDSRNADAASGTYKGREETRTYKGWEATRADDEVEDFAKYRIGWENNCCNNCDHFEYTTALSSMQFTHYTPGIVPYSSASAAVEALQIFSIKLKLTDNITRNFKLPLSVYGMVAVRDNVDSRRNILFSCGRTVAQELTQADPFFRLIGPSRAIVSEDKVYFEIQMKVKGAEAASQDKPLITCARFYNQRVSTLCIDNLFCTLEFCLQTVKRAVQATIVGVQVVNKKDLCPLNFTYGGMVACTPLPMVAADSGGVSTNQKILLIESKGTEFPKGDSGYVHLWRQVVCIERGGALDVVIQAYSKSGAVGAEGRVHFKSQNSNISQQQCIVGQAQVTVAVAWSLIPKDMEDVMLHV